MNQIVNYFKDSSYIQVGDHYIPMELTPLQEIKSHENVFFPFAKGVLQITGPDRIEFIHNLATGDIKNFELNKGYRTLFTDKNGRIQFDTFIILFPEALLIITDPGEELRLLKHLEFFQVIEDITMSNISPQYEIIYAFPENKTLPPETIDGAWELMKSPDESVQVFMFPGEANCIGRYLEAGLQPIGLDFFDNIRPIYNLSRAGVDFSSNQLPQEASLEHCVSFLKGCYLGQEPISRIAYRGHENKKLKSFVSLSPLETGMPLHTSEKEVGVITSASTYLTDRGFYSLGYVRTSWLESDERPQLTAANQNIMLV